MSTRAYQLRLYSNTTTTHTVTLHNLNHIIFALSLSLCPQLTLSSDSSFDRLTLVWLRVLNRHAETRFIQMFFPGSRTFLVSDTLLITLRRIRHVHPLAMEHLQLQNDDDIQ